MSPHPHDALATVWPSAAKDFSGSSAPVRIEADIQDLQVFGTIPQSINGTFYRVFPDPISPQGFNQKNGELFVPIHGDGAVSAFRIKDGHIDWKHRYVHTERYLLEKKNRRPLFGVYRNPFTDHPCVKASIESTANTNVLMHAGKLLALKESSLPYELDPNTLKTISYDPFELPSQTFTAHPKLDAATGELFVFGYEAKGLCSRDIYICILDAEGKKTREMWFEWPRVAFMHDCILTPTYIILYSWSYVANLDNMKAGGHHWEYDPECPTIFAVIPRTLSSSENIRWFDWRDAQIGHIASGWEEGNVIHFQSSLVEGQDFGFFPRKGPVPPGRPVSHYAKFTIDLDATTSTITDPEVLIEMPVEFPRVDDRTLSSATNGKFRYSWTCGVVLPEPGDMKGADSLRIGLNSLLMHDNETGTYKRYFAGYKTLFQEPVFIPRGIDSPEGDGYIMALTERYDIDRTELVILDTASFEGPPIAVARLPLNLKPGIHGNWCDHTVIPNGEVDLNPVEGHVQIVKD